MSAIFRAARAAFVIALLLSSHPSSASAQKVTADVVIQDATIFTADMFRSRPEAVAIKDGKFIAVGSNEEIEALIGPGTKEIEVDDDEMIMPGIVDCHLHALRGALGQLDFFQFPSSSTIDQIKQEVKKAVSSKKAGEWAEGKTFAAALAPQLNKSMLDEVAPNNPVILHDDTNHNIFVNSAALKVAGITKDTPDPTGGVIDRDSGGQPTGIIREKAAVLITKHLPPPTEEHMEEAAIWIFSKCNRYGITAARTAQCDAGRINAYRGLEKKGKLTVRLKLNWDWNTRYAAVSVDEMAKVFDSRKKRGAVTPLIDPDGVKIYTDGVPNGYGSPFIEVYSDKDTYGSSYINQPDLSTAVTRFDKLGLSVMLHAIGDQAVRNTLNAIEAARKANGSGGPRHHISHNFSVHPGDRGRAAKLNTTLDASPNDVFYPSTMGAGYAKMLGRQRMRDVMPVRSLVEAGDIVGWGSDWDNIPEPDPWDALEGLITRSNPENPSLGKFGARQAIDLPTALEILTINGAYAMGKEKVTGSIEVGKDADYIVLDHNLFEIPAYRIHQVKVLKTVLMGNTVWGADD